MEPEPLLPALQNGEVTLCLLSGGLQGLSVSDCGRSQHDAGHMAAIQIARISHSPLYSKPFIQTALSTPWSTESEGSCSTPINIEGPVFNWPSALGSRLPSRPYLTGGLLPDPSRWLNHWHCLCPGTLTLGTLTPYTNLIPEIPAPA